MPEEQFAIGSVLDDRYRIDAVLGTGGMGRVYRAEHTKIGKMVAIKVLHADLNRNREASQRFQREAIASGRLDHPNIVGVSDFGVLDDGACYLVMEVLEGESLGDRLGRDHRIHWVEAIDILRGVLYGLRHAHDRGVVHRDIKPDNVYLAHKDGEPIVKILDFGIAKLYLGNADDPAATRAGLTVGTPAYLSPEQAVGGEITPASDLYSATIVLYEMLAGRAPFEDKDPLSMLGAHVGRRPPAFAEVAPGVDIPAPLEEIVQRGLVKAAAQRINTATDYLAMLDAFSPPLRPAPSRLITGAMAAMGERDGVSTPIPGTPPAGVPTSIPGLTPVSVSTPVPGTLPAGVPTPVPGTPPAGVPTPVPGTLPASVPTPVPGMTPPPTPTGSLPAAPATPVSLEVASLPRGIRAVSLADASEPIPLTWIVRSGVVVGLVIIGAIVLAIATHCSGSASTSSTKSPGVQPAAPSSNTKPRGQAPNPGTKSSSVHAPSAKPSPAQAASPSTKPSDAQPPSPSPKPPAPPPPPPSSSPAGAAKPAAVTLPATGVAPAADAANEAPVTGPAGATGKPAAATGKPAAAAAGKPAAAAAGKPAAAAAGKPAAAAGKPVAATGKPVAATGKPATETAKPVDRDTQLKLLLHDLEAGKTCAERRAAISKLVELHDARALPPLKRARVRAGYRDDSNACLKADADRAIKELASSPR